MDPSRTDPLRNPSGSPPPQMDEDRLEFVREPGGKASPGGKTELAGERGQDRYKIVDVLGEGGFGTVYLAEDNVLKQRVAIKVLHLGETDERTRQRFIFEARTAANLRHSGIVNVFDIVQTADGLQQVMEYYPGGTLKDLVEREGALPPKRALEITLKMLEALAFAHKKGIIHRDIKPANIFFAEDGSIKIGDFGLCASFDSHDHTLTGESMGTPLYMAPEQMKDAKATDRRADIYSAGLTLYYMLSGERPTIVDLSMLPAPLRPIISRSTAQLRERRFATCEEFMAMIEEVLPLIGDRPPVTSAGDPFGGDGDDLDLFESAVFNLGGPGAEADSTRTGQGSSISSVGRSISTAVVAAVIGAFLTLGIVGGYITLTSNRGAASTGSVAPVQGQAAATGTGDVPPAPGATAEASAAAGEPGFSPSSEPASWTFDAPQGSTGLAPVDQQAALPFATSSGAGFPTSGPDGGGRMPPDQGQTAGTSREFSGDATTGFPRQAPQGAPRPSRRPPQMGSVETLDLPFFFPRPAVQHFETIFYHLNQWIAVEGGASDSASLMTAAEMLQHGSQVDRRNPVYFYLMGRIAERLGDETSARNFYSQVHVMAPILMSDPSDSMRTLVEEAGAQISSPEVQGFVFGRPGPTYR